MGTKIPKPDKQFLETAQSLQKLIQNKESTKRSEEKKVFGDLLRKKFEFAFGFSPDRMRFACRLWGRIEYNNLAPKAGLFDRKDFFQRGENLVFVSQPYGIDEIELTRWTKEFGVAYVIANEWSYYYPGHSNLFFIEFSPKAKTEFYRRVRPKK